LSSRRRIGKHVRHFLLLPIFPLPHFQRPKKSGDGPQSVSSVLCWSTCRRLGGHGVHYTSVMVLSVIGGNDNAFGFLLPFPVVPASPLTTPVEEPNSPVLSRRPDISSQPRVSSIAARVTPCCSLPPPAGRFRSTSEARRAASSAGRGGARDRKSSGRATPSGLNTTSQSSRMYESAVTRRRTKFVSSDDRWAPGGGERRPEPEGRVSAHAQ